MTTAEPGFSYPEIGATCDPGGLPPAGYRRLHVRTRLGAGAEVLRRAGEQVLGWRMHRAVGVRIDATAPEAAAGVRVTVGLWRLRAPCAVVWAVREPRRVGFAYGTLPGHPERGEEAFLVTMDEADADSVWLHVIAFSRPARWYTALAGPLVPVFQRAYARRCGVVLRRLSR